MSGSTTMNPLRRGPIPGTRSSAYRDSSNESPMPAEGPPVNSQSSGADSRVATRVRRRRSANYAATRLTNFRLPVDLHDRFRRLVREVEDGYPDLRRPSLTDLIIGLLEEGPSTVEEVAAVIRRKRLGEFSEEASR